MRKYCGSVIKMRSLLKDVSVNEMRRMRDNGMTNADIAEALGCTAVTVRRYIGPQPGRNWGGYRSRAARPAEAAEAPKAEASPACLAVTNSVVYLQGVAAEYAVDAGKRRVNFMLPGMETFACLDFDKWPDFAREVAAVARKLDGQSVPVEMW